MKSESKSEIPDSPNSIHFSFENICYSLKKEHRPILTNCSGRANPGRLLAIIGTSGAGKSSLLNILAGRLRSSRKYEVTGEIKLNGTSDYSIHSFRKNAAYVKQQDLVYETLNARETFELSAILRLPKNMTPAERKDIVEANINSLSLQTCANSLVGGHNIRGISGGERKRVSIGNELVTDPSLFFVDEPTSGLDSSNAVKIVDLLLDVAHSGRTVITTIHQPSSAMFRKFDDLLIMSRGIILYNGPVDRSIAFFSKLGYELPVNCNPADYFLEVSEVNGEEDLKRIEKISDGYKKALTEPILEGDKTIWQGYEMKEEGKVELKGNEFEGHSFLSKTWYLMSKRTLKNYLRMPTTSYLRLIQIVFFSLMSGILFFRLGDEPKEMHAKFGALFFIVTNITFNSTFNVILVFPLEKPIFKNELSNGMYNVFSYCFSKFLIEMPLNMVFCIIYQGIAYWMIGFANEAKKIFLFYLIIMTTSQIGYLLGTIIGMLASSPDLAITLSSFILLPSMLFSGFFIKVDSLNIAIRWIPYIDFFRYAIDLVIYNEFNGSNVYGDEILKQWNLTDLDFWLWYGILVIIFIVLLISAVFSLWLKTRNSFGGPLKYPDEANSKEKSNPSEKKNKSEEELHQTDKSQEGDKKSIKNMD